MTCSKERFIADICAVCGCMQFAELAFVSVYFVLFACLGDAVGRMVNDHRYLKSALLQTFVVCAGRIQFAEATFLSVYFVLIFPME